MWAAAVTAAAAAAVMRQSAVTASAARRLPPERITASSRAHSKAVATVLCDAGRCAASTRHRSRHRRRRRHHRQGRHHRHRCLGRRGSSSQRHCGQPHPPHTRVNEEPAPRRRRAVPPIPHTPKARPASLARRPRAHAPAAHHKSPPDAVVAAVPYCRHRYCATPTSVHANAGCRHLSRPA